MAIEIESAAARVRERLERASRVVPGLQYAMTDESSTRLEHHAGLADVRANRPVTAQTLFMAASCTKVITAAAVVSLCDAGHVDLDASLSHYYGDHPFGRGVTIRQLLAHTAGVPNPLPINWLHLVDDASFDEAHALAAVLRAHPGLRSKPGERYHYSNVGYWLLGKVIEGASGRPYDRYVDEAVLSPLGVSHREMCFRLDDPDQLARGYQRTWSALGIFARLAVRASLLDGRDGKWLRFARVYMDGAPYGGLLATASGFCRFLRGQLVRAPTTELGWRAGHLAGVGHFGKPGGGPGFCGNVRVYPSVGIATAWFANQMEVSEARIAAFTDAIDRGWFPD